jgi:hypothetical protein
MPLQKGISGNPGGRPKKREQVIEIEPLARKYAQLRFSIVRLVGHGGPFRRKAS